MATLIEVWPRRDTTVTLESGYVITAAGVSTPRTDEIDELLRGQRLLTSDPSGVNPDPSPISDGGAVGDATVYVVPAGAYGVVGNGVADDRQALHSLLNATISASGGTVTLQGPKTFRIASDLTIPAHVTLRVLHGAVLAPDAGVVVTVLGPIEAGLHRCFDLSAAGSLVLLPGKTVWPEWWGAKNDSGATDCYAAVFAAGLSLQGSSGCVEFCGSGGFYGISRAVDWTSPVGLTYGRLEVRGRGWDTKVKHTAVTPFGNPLAGLGLFTIYGSPSNYISNLSFSDIWLQGAGSTDYQEIVQWAFADNVFMDRVKLTDIGLEGLISLSTDASHTVQFRGCYAENIGKASLVSAYNTNAHDVIIDSCWAINCAVAVEHTGPGLTVTGCIFDTLSQRGLQIFSTSAPNEAATVSGNVIRNTPQGIVVQDASNSIGRLNITGNTLVDCSQCINVTAVGNGVCTVSDNHMIGGNQSTEAIYVGPGRHVIRDNTFTAVAGATTLYTGAVAGAPSIQVPAGTSISRGCKLTIAGDGYGERTVTATEFAGPYLVVTLSGTNFAGTIASGTAVAYRTERWAYCIRVGTDDFHVIQDNIVSGDCWTTTAFSLAGFKAIVKNNVFQLNGATSTGAGVFGVVAGSVLTGLELDINTPFTYSYSQRSEITCVGDPVRMTWKVGDKAFEQTPVSGGSIGRVCTAAGTAGTLATTGAITIGTKALTVASATGIYVGAKITIAGVSGVKTVTNVSGTSVTIDTNADATALAGSAVAYSAPTWKTFGAIA